jgi:restriction system protein
MVGERHSAGRSRAGRYGSHYVYMGEDMAMAIPDFQSIMLPLLSYLHDGLEHANHEILAALASHFHLTPEERSALLPSGRRAIFTTHVSVATAHLRDARLVESPKHGYYRLSARGREVLHSAPPALDVRYLQQFPEYRMFRGRPQVDREPAPPARDVAHADDLAPEDHLEYGFQRFREALASEVLARVKQCSPTFFERLVVDLLVAMGYGGSRQDAGRTVGRSGDGGIDGLIKVDRLGLDMIYVQAKRWEGIVGRPDIQKFAGALQGRRAKKGVLLTTSDFTQEAIDYSTTIDTTIVLINGRQLAHLMIEYGIGVTKVAAYEIHRIDSDYFEGS